MITLDSRGELLVDGVPACSRCQWRPRRPYPQKRGRVNKRKYYSYCGPCHAEYTSNRRIGKREMLLSPEECQLVMAARKAPALDLRELIDELFARPAGRHHAV